MKRRGWLVVALLVVLAGVGFWKVKNRPTPVQNGYPTLEHYTLVKKDFIATDEPWKNTCVGLGNTVIWSGELNRLVMLYSGANSATCDPSSANNPAGREQVGAASSNDGLNWTDLSATPFLPVSSLASDPDSGSIAFPQMAYDAGQYYVYYICTRESGFELGRNSICMSSTPSLAHPVWTRHGVQVGPGEVPWGSDSQAFRPDVVHLKGKWYMFFNAGSLAGSEDVGFAVASSPLGPWKVDPDRSLCHLLPLRQRIKNFLRGKRPKDCGDNAIKAPGTLSDPELVVLGDRVKLVGWSYTPNLARKGQVWVASTSFADFPYGWKKDATLDRANFERQTTVNVHGRWLVYAQTNEAGLDIYEAKD